MNNTVPGNGGSKPHIKAIETRYAGCRFRSRLEARWAVFFDALGIEWEYEAQGFDLPVNGRYLPDFWLPAPAVPVWVEVKGAAPTALERAKIIELGYEANKQGHKVRLLVGDIPRKLARMPIGEHSWQIPEGYIGLKASSQAMNRFRRLYPSASTGIPSTPSLQAADNGIWLADVRDIPPEQRPSPGLGTSGVEILASGHQIALDPMKTVPGISAYMVAPQWLALTEGQANEYFVTNAAGDGYFCTGTFTGPAAAVDPDNKLENWGLTKSAWLPRGPDDSEKILAALTAARSARFEHGQSGAPR